jgi:hypothetical protein
MSKRAGAIAVGLVLVLQGRPAASPDLQQGAPPPTTEHALRPLPPPGTERLIRIGPQALVVEDDQGRVTMADEPADEPRGGRALALMTRVFGVLGAGFVFELQFGLRRDIDSTSTHPAPP